MEVATSDITEVYPSKIRRKKKRKKNLTSLSKCQLCAQCSKAVLLVVCQQHPGLLTSTQTKGTTQFCARLMPVAERDKALHLQPAQ